MIVAVRNDFSFHYPKPNDMEAAFQAAVAGDAMDEADWGVYFTTTLLNTFFFVSDYVFSHGIANAVQGATVAEAPEKLLMSLAPIANDVSEVAYDFARALFVKYLGPEVGMTVVAQIKDAPNIDKLRLPFYTEVSPDFFRAYSETGRQPRRASKSSTCSR